MLLVCIRCCFTVVLCSAFLDEPWVAGLCFRLKCCFREVICHLAVKRHVPSCGSMFAVEWIYSDFEKCAWLGLEVISYMMLYACTAGCTSHWTLQQKLRLPSFTQVVTWLCRFSVDRPMRLFQSRWVIETWWRKIYLEVFFISVADRR